MPVIERGSWTARDPDLLGAGLRGAFPVDSSPCFPELLDALDRSDASCGRQGSLDTDQPF